MSKGSEFESRLYMVTSSVILGKLLNLSESLLT